MSGKFSKIDFLFVAGIIFAACVFEGCSAKASDESKIESQSQILETKDLDHVSTIEIKPNSPSETVRAFYGHLRKKSFREALFLTNLRPAIEGLTDAELKEFQVDFDALAVHVPADVAINGEVISGENAVVMARLPSDDPDKFEVQEIKLRRDGDVWIIQTVDKAAEKLIKKEGKNYFNALRIETHQDEAKKLLNRLADVEMVYALQNKGVYADLPTLITAGLVSDELQKGESTGYKFEIKLSSDKKSYSATAVPTEYGKSEKLSFIVEPDAKKSPHLQARDNGGSPLKN